MCSVKGCVGVQVKLSSLHGQHFLPNGSSSWECDVCHRVTNLVAPSVFSGKSLTGVDKPWALEVEAENRLAAAMVVYRERKFKNARALLERFLADYNDKLVGLPISVPLIFLQCLKHYCPSGHVWQNTSFTIFRIHVPPSVSCQLYWGTVFFQHPH